MKKILVLYVCLCCRFLFADRIMIKGWDEYHPPSKDQAERIEHTLKDCPRFITVVKLLSSKESPDLAITFKSVGKNHVYDVSRNLHDRGDLELPVGDYRITCPSRVVVFGEWRGDTLLIDAKQMLRASGGQRRRRLEIYCLDPGSLVSVRGRVVDLDGSAQKGVDVSLTPFSRAEHICLGSIKTVTGKQGEFVFDRLPPAALDGVVYSLLYGGTGKPWKFGQLLLEDADIVVGKDGTNICKNIKLVSSKNLAIARELANRIRANGPLSAKEGGLKFVDERLTQGKLPASTNNVIYVGDIVLGKKTTGAVCTE